MIDLITQVSGFIKRTVRCLEVAKVPSCKIYSTQPRTGRNTLTMGIAHRRTRQVVIFLTHRASPCVDRFRPFRAKGNFDRRVESDKLDITFSTPKLKLRWHSDKSANKLFNRKGPQSFFAEFRKVINICELTLRLFAVSLCSLRFKKFLNGDLMNKRLFGVDSINNSSFGVGFKV